MPSSPLGGNAARACIQAHTAGPHASEHKGPDPLQSSDPWQAALDKSSEPRVPSGNAAVTSDAARQIEQSVLQKLKASQAASNANSSGSTSVEASIVAKLESRLASSHGELDARINKLDGKVAQVAQKLDSQESLLQSLFAQQMSRIEELIGSTKKPRAE